MVTCVKRGKFSNHAYYNHKKGLLNWGVKFSTGTCSHQQVKKKTYLSNTHRVPWDLRNHLGQSPHFRDGDARVRDMPKFPLPTAESCMDRTQISWTTGQRSYSQSRSRRWNQDGLWSQRRGFKSQLCHSLPSWSWTSHLTFLSSNFIICTMKTLSVPLWGCGESQEDPIKKAPTLPWSLSSTLHLQGPLAFLYTPLQGYWEQNTQN